MHAYKLICAVLCGLIALPAWSSYAIYIGKNLTAEYSADEFVRVHRWSSDIRS